MAQVTVNIEIITRFEHAFRAALRDWLDARERQYIEVYRCVLGFAYLVLAH